MNGIYCVHRNMSRLIFRTATFINYCFSVCYNHSARNHCTAVNPDRNRNKVWSQETGCLVVHFSDRPSSRNRRYQRFRPPQVPVKTRHGRGQIRGIVFKPNPKRRQIDQTESLYPHNTGKPRRPNAGGLQRPSHGIRKSGQRTHGRRGISPEIPQYGPDRRLMRRQSVETAHQHVQQPLPVWFF